MKRLPSKEGSIGSSPHSSRIQAHGARATKSLDYFLKGFLSIPYWGVVVRTYRNTGHDSLLSDVRNHISASSGQPATHCDLILLGSIVAPFWDYLIGS